VVNGVIPSYAAPLPIALDGETLRALPKYVPEN
jgi:hypothetical protein